MKVLVAGASGVLGRQLVPLLVERGDEVTGMTRSRAKVEVIGGLGAKAIVADALDPDAVRRAVSQARPEVIVHELTALSGSLEMRHFDRDFAATNRLRTEATDHLLAAGREIGVRRFVAQSYAGWPFARTGGPVKTEEDPLDPAPADGMRETLAAIRHLEDAVTGADWTEGIVLRYGGFYGPGTSMGPGRRARAVDQAAEVPDRRRRDRRLVVRARRGCRPGDGGRSRPGTSGGSTTSSTTSRPRSPTGYRRWRRRSAASGREGCRSGSAECWPAKPLR